MRNYSQNAEAAGNVPTVNIAVNNNRQKRYNSNTNQPIYYLKDETEFQLELYNPTTSITRADIWLNGKKLDGGGLVLKPGQRVFLDRYFDSNKRFKFETYEVGKSKSVEKAIKPNGLVEIRFYKEETNNYIISGNTVTLDWNSGTGGLPYTYTTNTVNFGAADCCTTNNIGTITTTASSFVDIELLNDSPDIMKPTRSIIKKSSKKQETGMIGKGSTSNQEFKNVHYDFEYNPFYTVEYKILPISQKQNTKGDINVARYCSQCGSRSKPTFKFCSQCGAKV